VIQNMLPPFSTQISKWEWYRYKGGKTWDRCCEKARRNQGTRWIY